MVYMGGHISGAHYNPAITFAILIQKKIDSKDAGMYIIFQLIGAILASLLVYTLKGELPEVAFTVATLGDFGSFQFSLVTNPL